MTDPLFDSASVAVPVPELPGVFIRETPFDDVLAYGDRIQGADKDRAKYVDATVRLVIASVCDKDGKPLYTEADIERLSGLSHKKMATLTRAISRLNALDVRTVEAEAKNS